MLFVPDVALCGLLGVDVQFNIALSLSLPLSLSA